MPSLPKIALKTTGLSTSLTQRSSAAQQTSAGPFHEILSAAKRPPEASAKPEAQTTKTKLEAQTTKTKPKPDDSKDPSDATDAVSTTDAAPVPTPATPPPSPAEANPSTPDAPTKHDNDPSQTSADAPPSPGAAAQAQAVSLQTATPTPPPPPAPPPAAPQPQKPAESPQLVGILAHPAVPAPQPVPPKDSPTKADPDTSQNPSNSSDSDASTDTSSDDSKTAALPTPQLAHGPIKAKPAPADTQDDQQNSPSNQQPAAPSIPAANAADSIAEALSQMSPSAAAPEKPASHADATLAMVTIDAPSHQPSTTSATSASAAQESPAMDPQKVMDQVVLGLRGKIDPHNQSAQIHLEPQNLGSVHLSINVSNGILTADFHSANAAVQNLLSSHLDKLKTVLEGQGITVDRLTVHSTPPANVTPPPSATADNRDPSNSAHDGRSAGNFGYRGQQQPQKEKPGAASFAQAWKKAKAPIDLVA